MATTINGRLLGTVAADLWLNSEWYVGLDADEIADAIRDMLSSEYPQAEFDDEDIVSLAREIDAAARGL